MAEIWGAVAAAAVAAGASYYSSEQQKKAAEKAQKSGQRDIGFDISQYISGYGKGLPKVLGLEGEYRKQFQDLNLNEAGNFLFGKGQNLNRLSNIANRQASDQIQSSRSRDLRGMKNDAGLTRGLFDSLNPEGAAQVQAATAEAERARLSAQGLTGQEQRSAEQFAREQGLASGRIGDNSTIANGLLNRENILAGKRQEANAASQNAFGMSNQFYSAPGLQQLNQVPQSYQAGRGLLGLGLSSIGSATPQLVNPDVGVNLGAVQGQNQLALAGTQAQIGAQQQQNWMQLAGNLYGTYSKYQAQQNPQSSYYTG